MNGLLLVIDDYRQRVAQGLVRSDAESLAVLTALRQIAAEFKLPAAQQLIQRLRQQHKPIVLFSSFVDPLLLLHERLGGVLLTGRQKPEQRQCAVDRFQAGESDLLLATFAAGGRDERRTCCAGCFWGYCFMGWERRCGRAGLKCNGNECLMMLDSLKQVQTSRFRCMNCRCLRLRLLFRIHPVEALCIETILETA